MTMQDHLDSCKRRAYEIANEHPGIQHTKRLDMAARELGYTHFTALRKLYDRLGPTVTPSRMALLQAGLDPSTSPLRAVHQSAQFRWGQKSGADTAVADRHDVLTMTEDDVRAVIAREPSLTCNGFGVPRSLVEKHGGYDKALKAGQDELVDALDQCNKAIRFLRYMDKRKTINMKAGSSYGLKHNAEHFMRNIIDAPDDPYVSNGAFICAALHLGFAYKLAHPTSLNAHFNISQRSAPFKWRKLHDRRRHLYYQPEAKRELETLERLLGIEATTSD